MRRKTNNDEIDWAEIECNLDNITQELQDFEAEKHAKTEKAKAKHDRFMRKMYEAYEADYKRNGRF